MNIVLISLFPAAIVTMMPSSFPIELAEPHCEPAALEPDLEPDLEPELKYAMKLEEREELTTYMDTETGGIGELVTNRNLRMFLLVGDFTEEELKHWSANITKHPVRIQARLRMVEFLDSKVEGADKLKKGLFMLTEKKFYRWVRKIEEKFGKTVDLDKKP